MLRFSGILTIKLQMAGILHLSQSSARSVQGQTQKSGRAIGKSALPLKSGLHQVSLSGPFRADIVAKVERSSDAG